MGGVETDLIYPRALPDLFRGAQVTLIGRYRNASDLRDVRLRLSGKNSRERRSFAYENLRFPANSEENDFLPRLWATRRVGWLMEQIRSNGEARELRDEVVDLGTRYGIVTPYTSYLALEPGAATEGVNITSTAPLRNTLPGNRRTPMSRGAVKSVRPEASSARDANIAGGAPAPMVAATPESLPEPAPITTTGAAAVRETTRDSARVWQRRLLRPPETRA
jgi:Ca-activated chloride channel family protein